MKINEIRVIVPKFDAGESWSEAEVLGAMVFLWSQQDYYRQGSVESALANLLPIIRHRNFCLFIKDGTPIGYVNWAYFSEQEAADYALRQHDYTHFLEACAQEQAGKQLWMLSSFFPTGEVHLSRKILRDHVFKNQSVRFLHHRPADAPLSKEFSGSHFEHHRPYTAATTSTPTAGALQ